MNYFIDTLDAIDAAVFSGDFVASKLGDEVDVPKELMP